MMPSRILLISDLHLQESRPDISNTLLHFLKSNQRQCDALFILGDLFEVWIGDDDDSELKNSVASALSDFNLAGAWIFIAHGNRDFLLGEEFAQKCGASLISDPYTLQTENGPVILLHGDQLCTDDKDYMEFRNMVRQDAWQQDFLAKPLDERRAFAQQAREQSKTATADKNTEIMDVNQQEVLSLLHESGQTSMIHGHTHRPAIHDIELEQPIGEHKTAQRVVLGDWDKQAWYGEITSKGVELKNFPLSD